MLHIEKHFRETERLVRRIPSQEIAEWLLINGYFPEAYVLPRSFRVQDFQLRSQPYHKNLAKLARRQRQQLETISFPKSSLVARVFATIHPKNYHDAVYYLEKNWNRVLDHLFHRDLKIYSYSFPIPMTKRHPGRLGQLRSGRMIYEWLTMAEGDLVIAQRAP